MDLGQGDGQRSWRVWWVLFEVREDLCQVHEAYQYFRHKYKDKTLLINPSKNTFQLNPAEVQQDDGNTIYQKLTLGVQHRGRITVKDATKTLRYSYLVGMVFNLVNQTILAEKRNKGGGSEAKDGDSAPSRLPASLGHCQAGPGIHIRGGSSPDQTIEISPW